MSTPTVSRRALRCLSQSRRTFAPSSTPRIASSATASRNIHTVPRTPVSVSSASSRPTLSTRHPQRTSNPFTIGSRRTLFIQTEDTPNPDALKFNPNTRVLPESINSTFLEYLNPRSTLAPPHPSPLAAKLLNVDGVTSIFLGQSYITVTKSSDSPWAHVKPEVFAIINEAIVSGEPMVNTVAAKAGEAGQGAEEDSLAYNEDDDEVVGMIKELLETRIRPAIQDDGGDIEFRGFHEGQVLLKLRGACRTCDSSTVTLKNGIESMLMHYIEEVKGVQQVLDEEEEIALREFQKFEEKLKAQKGPDAVPKTTTLDSVEA